MHGCGVLHTHTLTQHSNIHCSAATLPIPSLSVPSPPEFRASENSSSLLQFSAPSQTRPCFTNLHRPMRISPHRPPLPCPAMSCPIPRPGCAGSRSPQPPPHPDQTNRPIAMAWYPRACGPPAAHGAAFRRPVAGLGRAREYSRVGALVGHAGIWEICMGVHKAGVGRRLHDGARGKKQRVSPHPCLARFRLGGVGGGRSRFPHPLTPTWVLYAYRFPAFLLHLSTR